MSGAVAIVGLGTGVPLSRAAEDAIDAAGLLIGGTRQLGLVRERAPGALRWDLTGRLKEVADQVASASADGVGVVVLASGDPMFFGVGSYLLGRLRQRGVTATVLPAPSALAVAAARFGLKWQDAHVVSGHGRALGDVAGLLLRHGKLGVFTDATNSPARLGTVLTDADIDGTAYVAEALGSDDERCRTVSFTALARLETHPLNVVFLVAESSPRPTVPFQPDDAFARKMPKKGLITKREVRVLSLAMLGVRAGDVCWDIGAGSGAVSIDMARCGARAVWAVEKNADGCEIILGNVARFGAAEVQVVHAKAPDGLDDLPDPDRVFVGGTGGKLPQLLELGLARLRPGGCLVLNAATVENLAQALETLRRLGAPHNAIQVQVSRSKPILGRLTRFEALNPVTILRATPAPESV